MDMYGSKRGVGVIPLVIFVILWIGSAVLAFVSLEDHKKEVAEVQRDKLEALDQGDTVQMLKERRVELEEQITYLGRLMGYEFQSPSEAGDAGDFPQSTFINGAINAIKDFNQEDDVEEMHGANPKEDKLYRQFGTQGYSVEHSLKLRRVLAARKLELQALDNQLQFWVAYENLVRGIEQDEKRHQGTFADGARGNLRYEEGGRTKSHSYDIPGKKSFRQKWTEDRDRFESAFKANSSGNAVLQDMARLESDVREKISEFSARVEKRMVDIAEMEKNHKAKKDSLKGQIQELVQARKGFTVVASEDQGGASSRVEEETPDGKIVVSNPVTGEVYINVGKDSGLQRGVVFHVYRRGRGHQWLYRGKIEVKKVLDKLSAASIVSQENDVDPVSAGDRVFNRFFDAEKSRHIAFIGDFDEAVVERMRRLLARVGGVLDRKVSVVTDFYVEAEDLDEGDKNLQRAKALEIRKITIEDLEKELE